YLFAGFAGSRSDHPHQRRDSAVRVSALAKHHLGILLLRSELAGIPQDRFPAGDPFIPGPHAPTWALAVASECRAGKRAVHGLGNKRKALAPCPPHPCRGGHGAKGPLPTLPRLRGRVGRGPCQAPLPTLRARRAKSAPLPTYIPVIVKTPEFPTVNS